jgi:hypothetical protein
MQAQVFQILSRGKPTPFDIVSPSDFTLEGGKRIDAQIILQDSTITLYCLDPDDEEAIFIISPSDVHLNVAPFYYVAQYEHAVQVIKVDYETLFQLADQADLDDQHLILIYSIGRSGTTVTSAAFDQAEKVISFSEPDVFTQLVQMRDFSGVNDALIGKLAAACMRLTCKQADQDQHPFWALKFRSFVTELADLIYQHFPEAKCLFLYRNAKQWLDSAVRAFGGYGYLSSEAIKGSWSWCTSMIRTIDTYPISDPGEITGGLLMGLMWLNNMERCLEMIEARHSILPVRYEDLKSNPLPVIEKLFEYCGVKPGSETALAEVFATDSQAGTPIARDQISQNEDDLSTSFLEDLCQVIAEHPIIQTPDYQLPGTLTID